MLRLLAELQTSVQQGVPVIGRFLTEYLAVWDGHQHFTAVLTLISQVLGLAITTMMALSLRFHRSRSRTSRSCMTAYWTSSGATSPPTRWCSRRWCSTPSSGWPGPGPPSSTAGST